MGNCEQQKVKDGGTKKFQSAHRADDLEKFSARAKICRPRADVKGHHWIRRFKNELKNYGEH